MIVSFIVSLGCSQNRAAHRNDMIGKYVVKQQSPLEQAYLRWIKHIHYYTGNMELTLKFDSSYSEMTCGNYINGRWSVQNDTLFLYCERIRWMNDSLERIRPLSCNSSPERYYIEGTGDLKAYVHSKAKNNTAGRELNGITWLKKEQ